MSIEIIMADGCCYIIVYFMHSYNINITVNREIFVYENIHVLNIGVNKFSRVPHKNILTQKFVKLKLPCTYRRLSNY